MQGELAEQHTDDWNPDVAYNETTGKMSDREMIRIDSEKVLEVNDWFASKNVFLPKARFISDGLTIKLCLECIKRKDVVGHDVVIVTEQLEQ